MCKGVLKNKSEQHTFIAKENISYALYHLQQSILIPRWFPICTTFFCSNHLIQTAPNLLPTCFQLPSNLFPNFSQPLQIMLLTSSHHAPIMLPVCSHHATKIQSPLCYLLRNAICSLYQNGLFLWGIKFLIPSPLPTTILSSSAKCVDISMYQMECMQM